MKKYIILLLLIGNSNLAFGAILLTVNPSIEQMTFSGGDSGTPGVGYDGDGEVFWFLGENNPGPIFLFDLRDQIEEDVSTATLSFILGGGRIGVRVQALDPAEIFTITFQEMPLDYSSLPTSSKEQLLALDGGAIPFFEHDGSMGYSDIAVTVVPEPGATTFYIGCFVLGLISCVRIRKSRLSKR